MSPPWCVAKPSLNPRINQERQENYVLAWLAGWRDTLRDDSDQNNFECIFNFDELRAANRNSVLGFWCKKNNSYLVWISVS